MNRRVVISGCSGGGKSTLIDTLAKRGFATVPEPGRRIVREELAQGGTALPWLDMAAFARRALDVAEADYAAAALVREWVFFDRGIIDAAVALGTAEESTQPLARAAARPYHRLVFLAPPWAEIYVRDAERPKDFAAAVHEHEQLARAYPALGYQTITLPCLTAEARADFVLATLAG